MSSDDWREFQLLTQRVTDMVKQTQEKLQEIEKTSTAKTLPTKPHWQTMADASAAVPTANLLDADLPKVGEPEVPAGKEWKPIHERIEEEIQKQNQKQKEAARPGRPPPPREPPPRRPPPPARPAAPAPAPTPAVLSQVLYNPDAAWDDENAVAAYQAITAAPLPQSAPNAPQPAAYASYTAPSTWDDETAVNYHADVPSYEERMRQQQPPVPAVEPGARISQPVSNYQKEMQAESESSYAQYENYQQQPAVEISAATESDSSHMETVMADSLENPNETFPPPPPPELLDAKLAEPEIQRHNAVQKEEPTSPAEDDQQLSQQQYDSGFKSDFKESPVHEPLPKIPSIEPAAEMNWEFSENVGLPPSESDFFSRLDTQKPKKKEEDPFAPKKQKYKDFFKALDEPVESEEEEDEDDPFKVRDVEDILAAAKAKAEAAAAAQQTQDDMDFFGQGISHLKVRKSLEILKYQKVWPLIKNYQNQPKA